MVTVTITIKPYLARYMYVRYAQSLEPKSENRSSPASPATSSKLIPIHLSHTTPIYHFLYQLSVPHPSKVSWKETGNITFVLPNVVLLSSKDSSFVQGTISNEQGIFSIDQTSGNNILRISCLGFIPVTKAYAQFPVTIVMHEDV